MIDLALAQPECVQEAGSWCARIYELTDSDMLARNANEVVGTALAILLILVLAVITRLLVHRAINRLTRVTARRPLPRLLQSLPEREQADENGNHVQVERRAARARTIGSVLQSIATLVIYGIAITLVLGELGINLLPIIASAGLVGLAVGFGAQNLVRDFLSGMFMIIEDQYGVGDWVDLGEAAGTVEMVGMRVTTLRDINGTVWYVRNGEVLRVGNSSQGHSTAVVDLPIGHGADVPEALDIARRVAAEMTADGSALAADVLEPPEVLGVQAITPEGVTLRITVKVLVGRQWAVQRALLAAVREAFADAGVPPPIPLGRPAPPA